LDHERLVELVRYEAIQAAQEGRQVDGLSLELDGLRQAPREELERLLGRLGQAPIRADFPYVEPDDLPTILAEAGGPEGEAAAKPAGPLTLRPDEDRKSTRLNSSHVKISYAVFCLKKKTDGVRIRCVSVRGQLWQMR